MSKKIITIRGDKFRKKIEVPTPEKAEDNLDANAKQGV